MERAQEGLAERFVDARNSLAPQIRGEMAVLVPLVVVNLADIQEDVVLVGLKLQIETFLNQFLAAADILEARRIIAEDQEILVAAAQSKSLAECLLNQRTFVCSTPENR
jgi:hypothetical protein